MAFNLADYDVLFNKSIFERQLILDLSDKNIIIDDVYLKKQIAVSKILKV